MLASATDTDQPIGLSTAEVSSQQKRYGKNRFTYESQHRIFRLLFDVFREPMFILLIVACVLYFVLGEVSEGVMMAITMVIVAAISIYQDVKSSNAIDALRQYAEPKVKVIRNGKGQVISSEELVPGDIIVLEEGMKVPADSTVIQSND